MLVEFKQGPLDGMVAEINVGKELRIDVPMVARHCKAVIGSDIDADYWDVSRKGDPVDGYAAYVRPSAAASVFRSLHAKLGV